MELEEYIKSRFLLAVDRISLRLENELKKECPVREGRLRNSIKVFFEDGMFKIFAAEHIFHVEFGTKPHIIKPKSKKALKFKSNGKDIMVKLVRHPGTKPNPFVRKTLFTQFPNIIREELNR